ncbi:MAG: hypothetical protein RI900_443 [Actinomycetota bacterium]|jgi:uncharacterized membrane protein YphA (DoxX/SURF4 family)
MSRELVGAIASIATGVVFLVSGASKVSSPRAWRAGAEGLGVKWRLAQPVPFVEIAVGAALAVVWQRRFSAWVAVVMLVAFTALLALRLSQGRRPVCACFGSWSAAPIGVRHLVRNAGFLVVALAAALL